MFRLALTLSAISLTGMSILQTRISKYDTPFSVPDKQWSGYTVEELNDYYSALGVNGCKQYIELSNWDFYPYMIAYTVMLGAGLIFTARRSGQSEMSAMLAPLTTCFDIVETYLQRQGCVVYPDQLDPSLIQLASLAVRVKWALLIVALATIILGNQQLMHDFLSGGLPSSATTTKKNQ